jgi:hypothetical protein
VDAAHGKNDGNHGARGGHVDFWENGSRVRKWFQCCSMQRILTSLASMLRRNLDFLSRVLICLAVLLSLIFGMTLWNRIVIEQHRSGYHFSMFKVTGAHFEGYVDGTVDYWLTGTIGGHQEYFFPNFDGKRRPKSSTDLLEVYPKGTAIEVLYNPDLSESLINGETRRVIAAGSVYWEEESSKLRRSIVLTFCPLFVAIGFFLFVRRVNR